MKDLKKDELINTNGGFLKMGAATVGLIVGAAVSFVIGAYSGYVRPYSCSYQK